MELTTFAVLLIFSVCLVWLWFQKKYNYWKSRGVITPPYSIPWGNSKKAFLQQDSTADRALAVYNEFKSKGLKHGGVYLMWVPMYVPVDITIVKSVMQVDFEHFTDRGMYVNEKNDPLSAHLFSLEGKRWKILRNKLTPTFTSGKLRMMYGTLVDCTKGMLKIVDDSVGHPTDIKNMLARFTTDVIGSCAFGLDCNSLEDPDNDFIEKGKAVFHRNLLQNIKLFLLLFFPDIMRSLNARMTPSDVSDFFMGVVKSTVAYRERNNIHRKDFMHLLIQLKNKGHLVDNDVLNAGNISEKDNTITMDEIAAQAYVFFEAGFESSSTTMTFCLYELAKNKSLQNKLRQEIERVLKKHNGQITYDATMDMQYLDQTINETLRKYPPLPSTMRRCTKEYKVPGTDLILEKGTRVLIPLLGIQRDPEFYPAPDMFDPERFSDENKKSRPACTFLPFGEGPRACIGNRFGLMQSKVGLIALLLNYEFSVNKRTKEPLEFDPKSLMMSTKGGMWLDIRKLTDKTIQLLPEKNS